MTIDPKTLEQLLTDQALGGLSPDAETLLMAYLADHPDARALSEQITQTVSGAQAVLADSQPIQLPPFPAGTMGGGRLARLLGTQDRALAGRAALVARIASLAACVLIGIGLHAAMTANTPSQDQGPTPPSIIVVSNDLPPRPTATEPPRPGFWSARQWYERSEQNRSEPSRRVIWDSPLTRPRLGDAT